ncbi:replication initiation protein [Candidatus Woesearchaeota archaeon]|nr:replication initiation protein [Candidatus Woesearchaeota archaeon]
MGYIHVSNIDQKNLMVTQANQVALASYSLTLEEKRLILFMTSLIKQTDKDFKVYRIPVTEIMEFLDIKGKDFYSRLREISKTLRSRPLSIEKPNGGWIETGWISCAEYIPKGEDGLESSCLDLSFDPKMKPFLLQLKSQFFSYMLENVANLKSIYSIRFYEIFASYRRLGCVTFEVDELKKRLYIANKYTKYDNFRKRILNQAQKELKQKTDIYFEYIEERQGRRVFKLHFTIFNQENPAKEEINKKTQSQQGNINQTQLKITQSHTLTSPNQQKAEQALTLNGVDQAGIERLINLYDHQQIIENSNIVLEKYKNGKIKNLASATVKAISEDWRPKLSPYEKKQEDKKQALIEVRKKQEEDKKIIEKLKNEFNENKETKINNVYKEKTDEEKNVLIKEFENSISNNDYIRKNYEKNGFNDYGVKILFRLFLSENLLKPKNNDFVEWVKVNKGLNVVKNKHNNEYTIN